NWQVFSVLRCWPITL
ncbi:hypothetical protein D046_1564B, partial [Vibrio parahaemolyticus V-223/04]